MQFANVQDGQYHFAFCTEYLPGLYIQWISGLFCLMWHQILQQPYLDSVYSSLYHRLECLQWQYLLTCPGIIQSCWCASNCQVNSYTEWCVPVEAGQRYKRINAPTHYHTPDRSLLLIVREYEKHIELLLCMKWASQINLPCNYRVVTALRKCIHGKVVIKYQLFWHSLTFVLTN